jgi:hypothetical protein
MRRRKTTHSPEYFTTKVGDTTYLLPSRPRLYICKPCGTDAWISGAYATRFSCECGCSCENHWFELEDGPPVSDGK